MSKVTKSSLLGPFRSFASAEDRRVLFDQVRTLEQLVNAPILWSSYRLQPEIGHSLNDYFEPQIVVESYVPICQERISRLGSLINDVGRSKGAAVDGSSVIHRLYSIDGINFSHKLNVRDLLTPPLVVSSIKPLAYRVVTGQASPADIVNSETIWSYWDGDRRRMIPGNVDSILVSAESLSDLLGLIAASNDSLGKPQFSVRYGRTAQDYESSIKSALATSGFAPMDLTLRFLRGLTDQTPIRLVADRWSRSRPERAAFDQHFRQYRVERHIPLIKSDLDIAYSEKHDRDHWMAFLDHCKKEGRVGGGATVRDGIWDAATRSMIPIPWKGDEGNRAALSVQTPGDPQEESIFSF